MNKDFKLICNVQAQIIFDVVMRVHDSIHEQMILLSQFILIGNILITYYLFVVHRNVVEIWCC